MNVDNSNEQWKCFHEISILGLLSADAAASMHQRSLLSCHSVLCDYISGFRQTANEENLNTVQYMISKLGRRMPPDTCKVGKKTSGCSGG